MNKLPAQKRYAASRFFYRTGDLLIASPTPPRHALLCPGPVIGAHFGIARSVHLSVPWRSCLDYKHAGCLQLGHCRPPEMCGLRTRPRTDVDPPRFLDRTAIGGGGRHIVSPPPARYLASVCVRVTFGLESFPGVSCSEGQGANVLDSRNWRRTACDTGRHSGQSDVNFPGELFVNMDTRVAGDRAGARCHGLVMFNIGGVVLQSAALQASASCI